jgi:haloalkane dehalogenase
MANTMPRSGEGDRPRWLPWSAFPFQSRFAEIAGQRVHYIDEGSGPALLFVSAGQWSFMFRDVIVRLRGQFRCLALDFPGCGLSPDAPGHDHSVRVKCRHSGGLH